MQKKEVISVVVSSLHDLSKAFTTYDRALFYFDETSTAQEEVDTNRTYQQVLDKLLPLGQILDDLSEDELKELAYKLGIAAAETYGQAISALWSRYGSVADKQSELLKTKIFRSRWLALRTLKKATYFDRDLPFSIQSTEKHLEKGEIFASNLVLRFNAHQKNSTWCPYTAEFNTLADICLLATQEIDYLNRRATEIRDYIHQTRNEYTTYTGLGLALLGLALTVWGTWKSPNEGKTSGSDALIQEAVNTSLAIEIGKIREHTSDIEHSLNSLSKDQAQSTTGE